LYTLDKLHMVLTMPVVSTARETKLKITNVQELWRSAPVHLFADIGMTYEDQALNSVMYKWCHYSQVRPSTGLRGPTDRFAIYPPVGELTNDWCTHFPKFKNSIIMFYIF